MAKNKFRAPVFPGLGSHVEDMSGIIGTITGTGKWVGSVEVTFPGGHKRDLFVDKLKPARYTPEQVQAMQAHAIELYESLTNARSFIPSAFLKVLGKINTTCPTEQIDKR